MASTRLSSLLLALLARCSAAAVMSAPSATITAAPLVKRAVTTIGYISTDEYDGTTLWDTITANEQGNAIATSESLFQICDPAEPCTFFSCSGDYVMFSTSSLFCGGSSNTCSYWELATDVNDQNPLTNYWCDDITSEGGIIYMTTPTDASASATSESNTSEEPVTISFTTPSVVATAPLTSISSRPGFEETNSSNDPNDEDDDSSTPVGAIAGGVVGGVVGLAAIIFGIWFCLRRKKRNQTTTTTNNNMAPNMQQGPPPPAPVQQYPQQQQPAAAQYYQEQKPAPQQYGHYDPNTQQAQAQPFYDPNSQPAYAQQAQSGYGMPGPEKTPAATGMGQQTNAYYADSGAISPVPQYSPNPPPAVPANINELPSGRM
ncbi:hypothetical protein DDE82_007768 [Stemphylium lycopersici]|nr:hypothetical protein TW65_06279 [Stemphylium lycopersici]RAQ99899.1 hypothetical protein DDE82_007768 [Stemphylium lycopersici]